MTGKNKAASAGWTEAEWLACEDDPFGMAMPFMPAVDPTFLQTMFEMERRGEPRLLRFSPVSERRDRLARLLACATARQVWHLLPEGHCDPYRRVIATAEHYADGQVSVVRLKEVFSEAVDVTRCGFNRAGGWRPTTLLNEPVQRIARALGWRRDSLAWKGLLYAMHAAVGTAYMSGQYQCGPFIVVEVMLDTIEAAASHLRADRRGHSSCTSSAKTRLCHLVRDMYGNPFRPVSFDPAWRSDTAVLLAKGIYESRDFSAMPILADALQDAGCENDDILSHCRGSGPHVRGCWVIDLVLGRA